MPLVDTIDRTLQIKIVFYGPGLSGKTTSLETLSRQMDKSRRGDLMVLDTTGDRTLFFDWMPVDLGKIRGFDVKIQLYTVPGQVRYNNTRKQVLGGVDGIVFVADSQDDFIEQNKFSFSNLRENLAEQSIDLEDLPVVIQYNKRDLPNALSVEELASSLNFEHYPYTETVASTGQGVVDTLRLITRLTLQSVKTSLDPNATPQTTSQIPLDGEGLLEHIMRAESETQPSAEEPTRDEHEESPYVEITAEASNGYEPDIEKQHEKNHIELVEKIESLEKTVSSISDRVEEIQNRLGSIVDKKLRSLSQNSDDLDGRMEVAQRLLTSLGGRMAIVERHITRMETAIQDSKKTDGIKEISNTLKKLAALVEEHGENIDNGFNINQPEGGNSKDSEK